MACWNIECWTAPCLSSAAHNPLLWTSAYMSTCRWQQLIVAVLLRLQEAVDAAARKHRPFKNADNEAKMLAKRAAMLAELQKKALQAKKFANAARQAAAAAVAAAACKGSRKQQAAAGAKRSKATAAAEDASPSPKRATPPSSPMSGV